MSRAVPPKQARSAARVDGLLDAAAELIVENGAQGFPFRSVARRAGAAHGSLYRFFPTRDAILTALHERHAAQAVALSVEVAAAIETPPPGDPRRALAAEIVRRFAPFYRDTPAYRAVRLWAAAQDEDALEDETDRRIVAQLSPVLMRLDPALRPERAETVAGAVVEIADALLVRAADDPRWEAEAIDAIAGYLDRAGRAG